MTLSITDNIQNLQQSPTCKRFLQIGRDYETSRDAGWVTAEVVKTLALSEYEKYNTARLEREANQPDEDFDRAVKYLHEHDKDKGIDHAAK
ncbi:MAG: hypothetical protein VB108_04900 [Anaerolineaceae bacterium]|nr:hypothetical protein [Anaerolineaceae bacterium]